MTERVLSDVEQVNFTILCLVRDAALANMADAITRFKLSASDLQQLCTMGPEGVLALVHAAGNELLFQPRRDLTGLLEVPTTVLGIMLSAQRQEPAVAAEPAL
ncbi:hypothetical protein [Azohydromonas lata]|uniref:Transcriptional regulator n=1 Tax=Azohydromonas lata TaxID=45677 RepID=A0ABU5I7K2_9BURK|nr:hypothetical protein [Azohydromonas lata]MDZ5455068.1 hypothetical protein [Azohydromonas lata]